MLLIDEIDKSDQEFEAFLLEILSDYQVTIPEIGTVGAIVPPIVLLTSNSTRDLGDALKRRCLHLHIGFPDEKLEARIIASRVPGIDARLLKQLVSFVQQLRALDLKKVPSVSETIDWARVMVLLHASVLEVDLVRDTLNVLLKFEADIEAAGKQLAGLTHKARQDAGVSGPALIVARSVADAACPPASRCAGSCRSRAAPVCASRPPRASTPRARSTSSGSPTGRC